METLGKALHRYGSPAHRLEEAMGQVSSRLGLHGDFFSTPTAIFASFRASERARGPSRTVLMRVDPGELSLEKLSRVDAVFGRVIRGEIEPEEAARRVEDIEEAPPRFGPAATVLAFAVASGSTARLFGGAWREWVASSLIGLVIGLLAWLSGRFPNLGRLFESVAAMVAATAAAAAAAYLGPLAYWIVTVTSLIVLVPGLTLTVAMTELATRHLVSGAARLAGALLVFLTMGFGFAVGSRAGALLFGSPEPWTPAPQPMWTEVPALLLAAAALVVLFQARPRDYGWLLAAAAVALWGSRAGAAVLGPELGALAGAILVGVAGNLFARLRDRPAAIAHIPGLMLLVPGSLGFRSVTALVAHDTLSGLQTAFTVVLVAVSLVTGLLVANVVLPPRRAL
ncbi:MAG: threonine/serine exporter family protein [Acidobacteriota bacterium]